MMKGKMLQRLIQKILLATVFLFSACDLNSLLNPDYDEGVNEFLKEYTETAGIMAMELDGSYPVNSEGITCLPCTGDRKIKFYLRNPQNYTLNVSMETEDSVNTDVTVKQDENDKSLITLLYPKDYLLNKDKDRADKSISGVIKIVEPKSGRSFADYSVSLHANSLPPSIENAVFQLDSDEIDNANYVICFYFPKLNTIEDGIHADVNVLLVNGEKKYINGTIIYSDEECESVDTAFTTVKPDGLTALEDSGRYQFAPDSAPDGYIPLYYKTNIKPSTDEIRYLFILQDKEGLKGNETGISNKAGQLKAPSIEVEADKSYAVDEDTGFYTLLISHDGLCEDGTSAGSVTINYTVKGGSSAVITGSSEGSVSIKLPKGTYEVYATAVKKFFITSEKSSVTNVKITRSPVFYVSEKGNDSENTGAKLSPYRTIQKAVDAFKADYDSSAECKIYVMTDLTPPEDFDFSSNSNSFISIPNDAYNISILGYAGIRTVNAGRSSENEGRVLTSLCSGSLTLSNINLTGGYTSENGGGIYNKGSLILSGVTVSGNKAGAGAGVYCESASSLTITGKNIIYDNMLTDGTKQSNIYLPVNLKINIDGDISGSKIGVNVPWQSDDEGAPRIGVPAEFTSGYGTGNTVLPGEIFIRENNYSITASSSGEAAFAVSGGGMYTALDYSVNLTVSSVSVYPDTEKTITIAVSGTRKEGTGTTTLNYNNADNKFYIDESKAVGDNKVTFAAALYNGATKIADCTVSSASEAGKIAVTIPAIAYEDTYTLRITSTYLGVTKDTSIEYKVKKAVSVASLSEAPTSGAYSLSTLSELEKIKDWVSNNNTLQNVTFTLEDDIDTNGEELIIGYYKYNDSANRAFMGVFDGNNHTITNTISASSVNTDANIALFPYVKGSSTVIKNLTVKGTSTRGSIVGYLDGNASVENCISETTINTSVKYIGGVVCYLEKGYVKNCINKGALTSDKPYVAGVVGYTNSGSGAIDRCINKGNISGSTSTGGIISYMQSDIPITNCKNYGNITNGSTCGGIIGFFSAGNAKAYNNCNLGEVQTGSGIVKTVDSTINMSNNCNSNTANYGVIGKFNTYSSGITAENNYSLNVYTTALYPSTASGSFNPSTITEEQIKSFELSKAGSVVESLNNWAITNSTSSLPYASWKLNADGKPELDLGEMDTW